MSLKQASDGKYTLDLSVHLWMPYVNSRPEIGFYFPVGKRCGPSSIVPAAGQSAFCRTKLCSILPGKTDYLLVFDFSYRWKMRSLLTCRAWIHNQPLVRANRVWFQWIIWFDPEFWCCGPCFASCYKAYWNVPQMVWVQFGQRWYWNDSFLKQNVWNDLTCIFRFKRMSLPEKWRSELLKRRKLSQLEIRLEVSTCP